MLGIDDAPHETDPDANAGRGTLSANGFDHDSQFDSSQSLFSMAESMSATFEIPLPSCIEILEWQEESGFLKSASGGIKGTLPEWMGAFIKILCYIWNHWSRISFFAALYVHDVPALDDITGGLNQQEFAKQMGVERATICAACKNTQEHFKRPPRRDQRKEESCEKMAEARNGQLIGANKNAHKA
jgi:hypothetical protein